MDENIYKFILNNNTKLTLGTRKRYIRQICHGLEYFHNKNLFHRDISLTNIFIKHYDDGVDVIKIGDFGLVKMPESTHIEDDIKTCYAIWAAEWASKLNYSGSVGIWQYSSKGKINGISGDVDLDTAYVDYPTSVKKAGLNGFAKQGVTPEPAPTTNPTSAKTEPNKTVTVSVQIGNETYKGTLTKS